jgi:hypothetical protein
MIFISMGDFYFCWLNFRCSYRFYLRFLRSRSLPDFVDKFINSWILESPDSIPILLIVLQIFAWSHHSVAIRATCASVGPI